MLPIGSLSSQFGPKTYREQEFIFSHGIKLFTGLHAGYSLKGLVIGIDDFGSSSKFGVDLGLHGGLSERLDVSLTGRNLNQPSFGVHEESIVSVWTSGFVFKVMPGLLLACDLEGIGLQSPRFKSGMELAFSPGFTLRGGLQNGPARFSGGFRARRGFISLDYAYQHHPLLPGSHHLALSFIWGEPERSPASSKIEIDSEKKQARKKGGKLYRFDQKINLLSATEDDLLQIPGVGRFTAGKIVAYRDQFGLKTIEDLLNIPGMTKRVFFILQDFCAMEGPKP